MGQEEEDGEDGAGDGWSLGQEGRGLEGRTGRGLEDVESKEGLVNVEVNTQGRNQNMLLSEVSKTEVVTEQEDERKYSSRLSPMQSER